MNAEVLHSQERERLPGTGQMSWPTFWKLIQAVYSYGAALPSVPWDIKNSLLAKANVCSQKYPNYFNSVRLNFANWFICVLPKREFCKISKISILVCALSFLCFFCCCLFACFYLSFFFKQWSINALKSLVEVCLFQWYFSPLFLCLLYYINLLWGLQWVNRFSNWIPLISDIVWDRHVLWTPYSDFVSHHLYNAVNYPWYIKTFTWVIYINYPMLEQFFLSHLHLS